MDIKSELQEQHSDNKKIIQPCKYRWIILFLYNFALASNGSISVTLFTISDVVCQHYSVSESIFILSSTIASVICLLSFILGMFLPSRYGLRTTMLIGTGVNAIGAALYIPASQTNGFFWFFISECCWGFATGIMYQLATDVSEVWFPAHQHALATNINMSMMNVGFGISYLQTMVLFNNSKSMSNADLQNHLNILIYSQSVPCLLVFVLILFFYRESPKYPPSISQARRTGPGNISFLETIDSIKILVKDYRFVIFAFIFGFNGAFGVTYPVIANLLITPSYNNSDKLVSVMGILAVALGFVGCVLFSMILDKTKKFKTILMLLLIVSSALFTMFSEFLIHIYPVYVIYLVSTLAWFFFTPTTGVLADIISEITYPINNSTSLAFCSVISGLFTAIVTQISGWLSDKRKVGILDYMLCGILGIQILLLIGVPVVKKRSLSDSDGVISSSVEAT